MDLIDLGAEAKRARKKLKMSRDEVAQLTRVSRARIEQFENGRAYEFGYKKVLRILNVVRLDLRLTDFNYRRPTLDDIVADNEAEAARERERVDRRIDGRTRIAKLDR